MVTKDQGLTAQPVQQQVTGLPAWYFVLAGLLVASFDVSEQFRSRYPLVAALPLVLIAVHITLWFALLSRRRRYIRSVWRTPRARLLVVLLFAVRLLLQLVLTQVTNGAT